MSSHITFAMKIELSPSSSPFLSFPFRFLYPVLAHFRFLRPFSFPFSCLFISFLLTCLLLALLDRTDLRPSLREHLIREAKTDAAHAQSQEAFSTLTERNSVEFLVDGQATFERYYQALSGAQVCGAVYRMPYLLSLIITI